MYDLLENRDRIIGLFQHENENEMIDCFYFKKQVVIFYVR